MGSTRIYPRTSPLSALYSDIKNSSKILKFFVFADKSSTLLIGNNIDRIEKIHHSSLDHMKTWLYANRNASCFTRHK